MSGFGLASPLDAHEWWHLWTCHLVHWDGRHLLLNVAAAIPPLVLLPSRARRRLSVWVLVSGPLVSAAILATGFRGEYRGASGLVVGMWVFAGLTLLREREPRLGLVLLAFIGTKLLLETVGAWPAASANFETVIAAHQAGALAGALLAFPIGWFKQSSARIRGISPTRQKHRARSQDLTFIGMFLGCRSGWSASSRR